MRPSLSNCLSVSAYVHILAGFPILIGDSGLAVNLPSVAIVAMLSPATAYLRDETRPLGTGAGCGFALWAIPSPPRVHSSTTGFQAESDRSIR